MHRTLPCPLICNRHRQTASTPHGLAAAASCERISIHHGGRTGHGRRRMSVPAIVPFPSARASPRPPLPPHARAAPFPRLHAVPALPPLWPWPTRLGPPPATPAPLPTWWRAVLACLDASQLLCRGWRRLPLGGGAARQASPLPAQLCTPCARSAHLSPRKGWPCCVGCPSLHLTIRQEHAFDCRACTARYRAP